MLESAAPLARTEDLVITESGQDLLVFDSLSNELHHLDALSAAVWRQLDGETSEEALLAATRESLGSDISADSIELAIVGLGKANLLGGQLPVERESGASSRRRFLKKAGLAASVPVIVSVTAPMAAAAATALRDCSLVIVGVTPCSTVNDCECNCNGTISAGACVGFLCANVCTP